VFSYVVLAAQVLCGSLQLTNQADVSSKDDGITQNEEYNRYVAEDGLRIDLSKPIPQGLQAIIGLCWQQEPYERRNFDYVVNKLRENQNWSVPETDLKVLEAYIAKLFPNR
jgi:hypothetical protein